MKWLDVEGLPTRTENEETSSSLVCHGGEISAEKATLWGRAENGFQRDCIFWIAVCLTEKAASWTVHEAQKFAGRF